METSHQAALSGLEQFLCNYSKFPINHETKMLGSYMCIKPVAVGTFYSSFILVIFLFKNKAFYSLKFLLYGDLFAADHVIKFNMTVSVF